LFVRSGDSNALLSQGIGIVFVDTTYIRTDSLWRKKAEPVSHGCEPRQRVVGSGVELSSPPEPVRYCVVYKR
jgi:hypothetical protein